MNTAMFRMVLPSLLVSSVVTAQDNPPPPPRAPDGGLPQTSSFDVNQLPAVSGRLQQFTLTGRGDIDGFILSDGTEIKTSPRLSTQLAYVFKAGDDVTVHGLRAAALPLFQAASVSDATGARVVKDDGPTPRPAGPGAAPTGSSDINGTVRMLLHGARGEPNGLLLADGTVLRLPPETVDGLQGTIRAGSNVIAQGQLTRTPLGTVLDVQSIGINGARMTPVGTLPPPLSNRTQRPLAKPAAPPAPRAE